MTGHHVTFDTSKMTWKANWAPLREGQQATFRLDKWIDEDGIEHTLETPIEFYGTIKNVEVVEDNETTT
jgi:hypothetical protein